MKVAVVFILWLILGFFYWTQASNCCDPASQQSAISAESSISSSEEDQATNATDAAALSNTENSSTEQLDEGNQGADSNYDNSEDIQEESNSEVATDSTDDGISGQESQVSLTDSEENIFYFETNSSRNITNDQNLILERLVGRLKNNFNKVVVTGYSDSDGSEAGNYLIGRKRAEHIKDLLIKRGISPQRIRTYTKGENRPASSNDNEEDKALNRRVEIKIIN